ncbi:DUF5666 domain-containing protein [Nevskia soli]|jgi:Cu/Ag efflux protein CusF|uniref:DUF5666 domain-containing protein n=1 Tax=Nevskia soli TaxID=418856 RepID=UPI0015D94F8B|nr:DUF5666 domain-containing protein [Nevskia soli]
MLRIANVYFPAALQAALCAAALCAVAPLGAARAQDAAAGSAPAKSQYSKVIGSVVAVSSDGSKITVKPDTGATVDVLLDSNTSYMQVPPGEKDLKKASRIELKDISEGDRVYARSRQADGQAPGPAVSVIVMSKTQVAERQQAASAEWQTRGAAGRVTAVDPAAKTVTIRVQGPGGPHPLTVQTDATTKFRRYAPDSIRFADAKKSDFGEIAVGNNVRVLGDKSADGASIHAEQLVSGSFRNVAGTVVSVDAAGNTIKVNDLLTKQPVTVAVNADTNMRKIPPGLAAMLARMSQNNPANAGTPGATPGANAGSDARQGQGGPDSHPGYNGPGAPNAIAAAHPGAAGSSWNQGGAGGDPGSRPMHMDLNQVLERSPQVALADLKPGDALIISSTNGSDPSRVMAVTLVAGVEPILAATPTSRQNRGSFEAGMWNLDMAMPQ